MQFVRYGENDMKMRGVEDPSLLFCEPPFDLRESAKGTHPMSARVVPVALEMTVGTPLSVATQGFCAASHDTVGSLDEVFRQTMQQIIRFITL